MNMMTPLQVWAGFDAQAEELDVVQKNQVGNTTTYNFLAMHASDGDVRVEIDIHGQQNTKKTVLIVGEYDRAVQQDLIDDLVSQHYLVCCVDYSAVKTDTSTFFPFSLEYGFIKIGKQRINDFSLPPKSTNQYLYTVIVKRAITFIQNYLKQQEVVLIGLKSGVDIAIQTAGSDNRILALSCIGGASYTEYLDKPKYRGEEIVLDDNLTQWLTSVSSVAYAKYIKIPVLITIGSNGRLSDIDRLSNIITLMADADVRINISARYLDNISKKSYSNFIKWLEGVFLYSTPPEIPIINIEVNSDGAIYATITTDSCIDIDTVKVYYSYGDNNHSTRYWHSAMGEQIGDCEHLAKLDITDDKNALYCFCEVVYKNGIILSSVVNYMELLNYKIATDQCCNIPIVYQYATKQGYFTEVSSDAILLEPSIEEGVLPIGIKGIKSRLMNMAIYFKLHDIADTKLLQIDTYSDKLNYELSLTIIKSDKEYKEYYCSRYINVTDSFYSLKLAVNDFKDKDYFPMDSWQGVKGIIVNSIDIVVGKIIFI